MRCWWRRCEGKALSPLRIDLRDPRLPQAQLPHILPAQHDARSRMKKKRALLLFGSIAAMLAGYAAWCGRTFYLSLPLPELREIPEPFRVEARRMIVDHGLAKPDHFQLQALLHLLARPYDCEPKPVRIEIDPSNEIGVTRERWSKGGQNKVLIFFLPDDSCSVLVLDLDSFDTVAESKLEPARP
jgi:hypothetical protein